MTSAIEVFTIELARASRKASRFLRHLSREDREDVLQMALLWCWENRENYSLTTSLDTWFVYAVRHALDEWRRDEDRAHVPVVETMTDNEPEWTTIVEDAVRNLSTSMDDTDRAIVDCLLNGTNDPDLIAAELGITRRTVDRHLVRMRAALPEGAHEGVLLRRAVTPMPDDPYEGAQVEPSDIDNELAKLDFPPEHGAECPPCWRCKWFEGLLPGDNKSTRMKIEEEDVRKAIADTERRKVEIAQKVKDGAALS